MDFGASKGNQFQWRDVAVGDDAVVPWEATGFPYRNRLAYRK
jgi:hypothetical protein